jgi:glycosyltransferase involved in cell wall biosynthesis
VDTLSSQPDHQAGAHLPERRYPPVPAALSKASQPSPVHSPARSGQNHPTTQVRPAISLIAPVYNEVGNLEALLRRVLETFGEAGDFELVLVDDGSTDGSRDLMRRLCQQDQRVRAILLARNRGQTAATTAGLWYAHAPLLATLDADLQNDPIDLPAMVAKLKESGADAVVGYRLKRQDTLVRRLSSRFANRIRNWISGDSIRDTGCSLKVFKAEAIRSVPMFEGMHRFLPTLLRYHGFTVLEHPVSHHPRVSGKSKYGVRNRALRAFKDLLAVRWMKRRLISLPIAEVIDGGPELTPPGNSPR